MIQAKLFLCATCGGDQPIDPHEHRFGEQAAVTVYQCPICKKFALTSEDPLDNTWVALGEAVCSRECHEAAYDLMRERQHEIPFYHKPP